MRLFARGRAGQKGMALTIAIMMIICSSVLAGYSLQAGWNQRKITIASGAKRDKIYWYAKAGVIHARWKIRNNIGGQFTNDAYDDPQYQLDINGDAVNDVEVNIGAVTNAGTGRREIISRGLNIP